MTLDSYKQSLDGLTSYPLNSISAHKKLFRLGFLRPTSETRTTYYSFHIPCDWQILHNEKLIYHHPILKATLRRGKQALEILLAKIVKSYSLSSPDLNLTLYFEDDFQLRILLKNAADYYELHEGISIKVPKSRRHGGYGTIYGIQEGKVGIGGWII